MDEGQTRAVLCCWLIAVYRIDALVVTVLGVEGEGDGGADVCCCCYCCEGDSGWRGWWWCCDGAKVVVGCMC